MIKVLVVDDHQLMRKGISRMLRDLANVEIVAEASSGEEALRSVREKCPDIVLMDVRMPGIGGLEATRKIKRIDPKIKVIALTAHGEEPYPTRLLQAGATGYLTKNCGAKELSVAIQKINAGQRYIAPEIAQTLAFSHVAEESENPFKQLTDREMQITLMITNGEKIQEIADRLFISTKTVNSHRYRVFEKLDVKNDVELTLLAIRHGMQGDSDLVKKDA